MHSTSPSCFSNNKSLRKKSDTIFEWTKSVCDCMKTVKYLVPCLQIGLNIFTFLPVVVKKGGKHMHGFEDSIY